MNSDLYNVQDIRRAANQFEAEHEQKLLQRSKMLNDAPVEVIRTLPEENFQELTGDYSYAINDDSPLWDFINKSPSHDAAIRGDISFFDKAQKMVPGLKRTAKFFESIKSGYQEGNVGQDATKLRFKSEFFPDSMSGEEKERLITDYDRMNELSVYSRTDPSTVNRFAAGGARIAGQLVNNMASGWKTIAGGTAVGAAAGAVKGAKITKTPMGAAAGAVVGGVSALGTTFKVNNFIESVQSEAGSMLYELDKMVDDKGNRLDPQVKKVGALMYGILSGGIETAGIDILFNVSKKSLNEAVKLKLQKSLTDPAVVKAFLNIGKYFGLGATGEGFEEGLQQITGMFTKEAAQDINNLLFGSEFEEGSVIASGEEWKSVLESGWEGFKAAAAFGMPVSGVSIRNIVRGVQETRSRFENGLAINEEIHQTKMSVNAPDVTKEVLDVMGLNQTVYLDPEDVGEIYEQNSEGFEALGILQSDIQTNIDNGNSFEVDYSTIQANFSGSNFKQIAEIIKGHPDALSQKQAERFDFQADLEDANDRLREINEERKEINLELTRVNEEMRAAGWSAAIRSNFKSILERGAEVSTLRDPGSKKVDNIRKFIFRLRQEGVLPQTQQSDPDGISYSQDTGEINRDDAFSKWFGESKVVNEKGEPVVMYHGSSSGGFDAFSKDKISMDSTMTQLGPGFYFTGSKDLAKEYKNEGKKRGKKGSKIYEVYLNVSNPLEISHTSSGVITRDEAITIFEKGDSDHFFNSWVSFDTGESTEGLTRRQIAEKYVDYLMSKSEKGQDREILKNLTRAFRDRSLVLETMKEVTGRDGVKYTEDGVDVYSTWSPNQIKAVKNQGTFDHGTDNIYRQDGLSFNQETGEIDVDANFRRWSEGSDIMHNDFVNYDIEPETITVVKAFHGTTHDFDSFDKAEEVGNPEGFMGRTNYFTTSEADAEGNYGNSEGPDLVHSIAKRAEEIADRYNSDPGDFLSEYPEYIGELTDYLSGEELFQLESEGKLEEHPRDLEEIANEIAKKELYGGKDKVMPVYIKLKNPLILGGLNDSLVQMDSDELFMIIEDVLTNNIAEWDTPDLSNLYEEVLDYTEEGISGYQFHTTITDFIEGQIFTDDNGRIVTGDLVAKIYEAMGYDSVVLKDAERQFPKMNIPEGTAHIHVFDRYANRIKSVDNVGTFDPETNNIYNQTSVTAFTEAAMKLVKKVEKTGEISVNQESGAIAQTFYSTRTWTDVEKADVKKLAAHLGIPESKVSKWMNDIDNVMARVLDNPDLDFFAEAADLYSSLKPNSEPHYTVSVDFSTLCRKRYILMATIEAIQLKIGKAVDKDTWVQIRTELDNMGVDVSCGACFVDSKRLQMGKFINDFIAKHPEEDPQQFLSQSNIDKLNRS